jgi:hypothetical protein
VDESRLPQEPSSPRPSSPQEPAPAPARALESTPYDPADAPPPAAPQPPMTKGSGRRISRRVQLAGLLLILVVVGAGAFVGQQLLAGTPTPTASKTVWQNITAGIRDTGVPKDVALEAFAYLYKVDIPGVTVPKGTDGADEPTSGSGAMRWVRAVWDQLTADQQAVINRYQVPGPNDIAIPPNPASPVTSTGGGATKPEFQLTAAHKTTPANIGAPPEAPAAVIAALEAELAADLAHIGPRLKMAALTMGGILNTDVRLHVSDIDGGNTLFTTQPKVMLNGHYVPCDVTAWSNAWQGQVSSSGQISDALHVEITHEVIHCYQNVVWGDLATGYAIPAWITEGTALYLAAVDTGIEEHMIAGKWKNDYFTPETPLTNRAYDAFGYYALLDYLGRDLWSLMLPGWTSAAANAQRSNSFIAVLRGDDQDVRDSWPTSYLRQDLWGAPWIMHGFGLPDSAQVSRHPAQALADPGYLGTLEGRSNTILQVTASVGEVVTVTTTGLANVHDESGNNQLSFQTQKFCTSGDCVCPANTPKAGQTIASKRLTLPFVLALNAPFGGSTYSVIGRKLEDECGLKATPQPQNVGPCVSKCAGSNGDPHLMTINNYRYDFQGAGEFTLLRSKDGSLEIQARQEPYVSTGTPRVATNTAIAAKIGSHRVGVYAGADALSATLDGKTLDTTKTTDLGGGARIAPYAKGLEIDFPDGTKLWTLWVGVYGINAEISPSDALRADGVGLLGTIVPGGMGVPALPDGTRLPVATDRHQRNAVLYGRYADAWRVTDTTTLFDYDAGKTTATYTQKGFPADTADVTFSDLTAEQRAAGGTACVAITDQQLNDACVFDVGVSGQSGFSDSYVAIQGLYDSGIAATSGSPAPQAQSSETPLPGKVAGALAVMKTTGVSGAVVGPDGKLYFSVSLAGGKFSLVEVDPTTGTIVGQVDIPKTTTLSVAAGSVWAPGLIVDSNASNCSVTRFDAQTLVLQATVPIPCAAFGPAIASDGDAIWYEDISKWDAGTAKGAVLMRLDPATNQPGTSVPLPFINGSYSDSQGALFVSKADSGVYRLATGGTAMDPFGQHKNRVYAAGPGFWASDTDKTAQYYTHADSPDATVAINGQLVGGDSSAAYAEVPGQDGIAQLWRYPADGSAPTQIGTAPTVDTNALSYFADPQPLPAPHGVAKYWVIASGDGTWTLYMQWLPLP